MSRLHGIENRVRRFLRSEDGPTAVEYAVMLAAILLVCLAAVVVLGTTVSGSFSDSSSKIAPFMTSGS